MKRLLCLLLVFPMLAAADESLIRLKEGPGKDLVIAKCAICHSLDYIPMNSPFLDPAGWAKEIDKMVKLGAPIQVDEIPVLLRYLNSNYGR
ncbi:cytochrome c [Methylotetracoccus oryzae]|uniref:cytochrome c n=1 Tax=Methylotetracoccus oryzae TaxID=1919059 RepID=UPI001117ED36|nr:cytochrome c [Methylotetracoccus oryzae]